jgi:DEAD/DEAH box helicase domain-containing protein
MKALAQDQIRALLHLCGQANDHDKYRLDIRISVCDGDTNHQDRHDIRKSCQLVITNPDMLHHTILPDVSESFPFHGVELCIDDVYMQHRDWSRFFANLKYIVLDEAHVYRYDDDKQ